MNNLEIRKIPDHILDVPGEFQEEWSPTNDIETTTLRWHLSIFFQRYPKEKITAFRITMHASNVEEIECIWTTNYVVIKIYDPAGYGALIEQETKPQELDGPFTKLYYVGGN